MADAVTLLSNSWNDATSFRNPSDLGGAAMPTTTGYRFGVVSGKSMIFTWPSAGSPHFLFGTDGGVGNFLRLLEDWNSTGRRDQLPRIDREPVHSRQATGTFKYTTTNVYDYGDRNFTLRHGLPARRRCCRRARRCSAT